MNAYVPSPRRPSDSTSSRWTPPTDTNTSPYLSWDENCAVYTQPQDHCVSHCELKFELEVEVMMMRRTTSCV